MASGRSQSTRVEKCLEKVELGSFFCIFCVFFQLFLVFRFFLVFWFLVFKLLILFLFFVVSCWLLVAFLILVSISLTFICAMWSGFLEEAAGRCCVRLFSKQITPA